MAGGLTIAAPRPRWPMLVLGLGSAFFFYMHLFRFPLVPIWHDGDQAIYLEHAERMLHGEVIYRDLFQFNLPGTEYLYEFLFRCFGVRLWIAPLTLTLTLTAITLLVYALSRLVLRGVAAPLPAAAFLLICERSALDASHNWYSTLLVLLAVYVAAKFRTLLSYGFAGALLGLASIFTSSRGIAVAVGLVFFFIWKFRGLRNAAAAIAALFVPLVAVLGLALAYLASVAGSTVLWNSIVVFPLRYYPHGGTNNALVFFEQLQETVPLQPYSVLLVLQWLALNVAAPLILILFIVRCRRHSAADLRNTPRHQTLVLYAFAGGFAMLAVAAAPSAWRLNCGAALAYIVAATILSDLGQFRLIVLVLAGAMGLVLADLAIATIRPAYVLAAQRGRVAFLHRERYDEFLWVARAAHPGDRLFGEVPLNVVLSLPNPAAIQWVEGDAYTRPEQVTALIQTLGKNPTRFIVCHDDTLSEPGPGDNLAPFRAYLAQHYSLARQFNGGFDIFILGKP